MFREHPEWVTQDSVQESSTFSVIAVEAQEIHRRHAAKMKHTYDMRAENTQQT